MSCRLAHFSVQPGQRKRFSFGEPFCPKIHSTMHAENRPSRLDLSNDQSLNYAVLTALFSASVASFLFCRRRSHLPAQLTLTDLVLLGLATQKLSRLATRSKIMMPVRAPFTQDPHRTGSGEIEETPRGSGWRKSIGELLTCPFCMGTWISLALLVGVSFEARVTRFVAGIFAVGSLSDFVQQAYCRIKEKNE
jgi:hypothetical protein